MEKEFVPYELAVKLKQLGFDEPCFGKFYFNQLYIGGVWINNDFKKDADVFTFKEDSDVFTSAPTYSQAFRWFREKYNIQSSFKFSRFLNHYSFEIRFQKLANGENPPVMVWHLVDSWLGLNLDLFETYEEAELACLTKLIGIVKTESE